MLPEWFSGVLIEIWRTFLRIWRKNYINISRKSTRNQRNSTQVYWWVGSESIFGFVIFAIVLHIAFTWCTWNILNMLLLNLKKRLCLCWFSWNVLEIPTLSVYLHVEQTKLLQILLSRGFHLYEDIFRIIISVGISRSTIIYNRFWRNNARFPSKHLKKGVSNFNGKYGIVGIG